jgi:hypothetical protein
LFTCIVRNFRKVKGTVLSPILFCLKKTGPGDINLMYTDNSRKSGELRMRAINAPERSKALFQIGMFREKLSSTF